MSIRRILGEHSDGLRRVRLQTDAATLAGDAQVAAYLDASNLRFVEPPQNGMLQAEVANLAHHTFARVTLPALSVEWPRTPASADRVVVLVTTPDNLEVTGEEPVLHRRPGAFLIPPGTTPVRFTLKDSAELFYISSDRSVLGDVRLPVDATDQDPDASVPTAYTAPLMGFVTAICSVDADDAADAAPLALVAREVVRSFISLFEEAEDESGDLYTAAMHLIYSEHDQVTLSVGVLASRLGVAPRTLQAAFAARGTTVSMQLRTVRVNAARTLRENRPGLPLKDVASATGFGSVSALTRAFRAVEAEGAR